MADISLTESVGISLRTSPNAKALIQRVAAVLGSPVSGSVVKTPSKPRVA